ncbi:unnamed protein product [Orchesella dallaii]|uniref:Uncharacterized protein n=1 Tax=Orchesella dallaii TaxID=48710 RepID=A0ABP1Q3J4_9HEXA
MMPREKTQFWTVPCLYRVKGVKSYENYCTNSYHLIVMKTTKDTVWLTFALSDSDVPNALILCFSLRRVFTPKRLAVIVSPSVSKVLREALSYEFDFIFTLDEERNTAELENEDFVKLFALTLQGFEKCVMLSPNMLVSDTKTT